MRLIVLLLIVMSLSQCTPRKEVMTEKEFAEVYIEALRKKYPTVSFTLQEDLSITCKKDSQDIKHHIDNAYFAYKGEPDSLNSILKKYLAASESVYAASKGVSTNNIIPVIKSARYLDEVNALNKNEGRSIELVTEKYNDQLIIVYAEDLKHSFKYIFSKELEGLHISKDSLRSLAMQNFGKIIPDISKEWGGIYVVTAGGSYEASLILQSELWTRENFPVEGDWVVGIPSRDVLLITGSNNKEGVEKIRELTAELFKTGNYLVSEDLFKWNGKKFELYVN
ncbi:DUF1444 family protein [Chitinophaga filiformis]|uniref:DUF1444 family protein n=1 Tax=Chitinophaga filiformis TaxID=104663 RepID=UPI001F3D769A|nr:DUF1444 family protein [Chitinophaga filiformis]MCF6403052.1 DUF1444 family protein [Chitinophaga filiformis]